MPSYLLRQHSQPQGAAPEHDQDANPQVHVTDEAEGTIAALQKALSSPDEASAAPFDEFEKYVRSSPNDASTPEPVPLSVFFESVTTYGRQGGPTPVKTLKDAIWRTLTCQDIYEGTLKRWISPDRVENGQALIRDFSGVVRNGEMMLVLGNPGSGCSTFLRTIGGEHASFLGVKGSISYSGLSLQDVAKKYRGAVLYVPEDDVHLPTLTVRQTLEFALKNKTPKKLLSQVPSFLREFGRIFGMTAVMDTLVGNEFIRGVSGGERKRVSILESLAAEASVSCWDGSTRGLDAASALDYIRSLRIMTDSCSRATLVSLYQASDNIYNMMDKLLLIDEGRMLYQGPACDAESYFNRLGYERQPRQTMSDFLTNVTGGSAEVVRKGCEGRVPRGAANLEDAFRSSQAYQSLQDDITSYKDTLNPKLPEEALEAWKDARKSKFVSRNSAYSTSFFRQAALCTKREMWQLLGHKAPLYTKVLCIFVCSWLLGSMFYMMPVDTGGVYSRGGFSFYSAATVAWFQLAELETAFFDRTVVSRQRRFAMVRPSAVVLGKTMLDIPLLAAQSFLFTIPAYFLGGMRYEAGAFFAFTCSIFLCAMAFVAFYRMFGAASPTLEVALRYCGIFVLVAMLFGGYIRSVDSLIREVPWVGWLTYTTPVFYAYEIIMLVEFHGREFPCAPDSVIPSGAGYDDPAFQSCAYDGLAAGQFSLQGDDYLSSHFGFSYDHLGRNFGILLLFLVALVAINMWLVEKIDWVGGGGGSLEFVHGGKRVDLPHDEEIGPQTTPVKAENLQDGSDTKSGLLVESKPTFTWRSINYAVETKQGDKQLLDDVSGYCEPGTLTALVGASGAGKSTLMTVLTQQATAKLSGEMRVDGHPIGTSFGQSIGYCQQMDIHVETSTVREAFEFSALLRQSSSISKSDKLSYVDEVLRILHMTELQHVVIRSLSLEQKKRTTIGVELCAKPSALLFLDEPTSGLDGQGAMNIVKLLRRLADHGQAIVCTIHQASQEQFQLFDRVLALKQGGRVYYFGETGPNGKTVVDYFSRHGVEVKDDKNIADLLIEVTARGSATQDWCDVWAQSDEAAAVLGKIDNIAAAPKPNPRDNTVVRQYASSTASQIVQLTKRTFVQYWRTPDYIYSRLYCSLFHALLNSLAFLQLGNSVAELQYRIFACFMVLMIVPEFINACAMMFDHNRDIWMGREHPSRIYGWTAFSTAQVAAEIPFAFAGAIIFYFVFYFIIGLPLGTPAGYSFIMIVWFHLFSTSWGQWIAALSSDAVMAASIMPFFIVVGEFFNGIIQPQSLMPAVWAYTAYYVSPFTYWISGLVSMILTPVAVTCTDSELITFDAPANSTCGEYASDWLSTTTGYLANPDASSSCGYCQYTGGADYLSTISVSASEAWQNLGIFTVFVFTNYALIYVCVYVKSVKNWLPW